MLLNCSGLNKRATSKAGQNAIHVAVQSGNIEMLVLMTDPKLAIPNEPDNKGMLPIHLAVLTDNYEAVVHLLKLQSVNGESDVNKGQAEDFTPVHYACHRGNLMIL